MTSMSGPEPEGRGPRLALFGFGFASLCAVVPAAMHASLPLEDVPNHMARHHVMARPDIDALQLYYATSDRIVPNAAVDLLWRLAARLFEVERFAQIVTALQGVMLIASVMILARTLHGRWTAWSAASGLLLWNAPVLLGLQNYTFALPFAILALALWLAAERWSLATRVAVFVPVALLLYVMHFFAFAALAIAVFGRQLQLLVVAGGTPRQWLLSSIGLAIPFLLPLAWLLADIMLGADNAAGSFTSYGDLTQRLFVLLTPFLVPYADGTTALTWTGLAAGVLVFVSLVTLLTRRSGARLVLDPRLKGPVLALLLACLLAPAWLNGVATVQVRLPLALIAVLLAGTRWVDVPAGMLRLLFVAMFSLMAARSLAFEHLAAQHDADVAQLRDVLAMLPPASRMLPLRSEGKVVDSRLGHADAYAVIDRNAFVPGLFQGVHSLIVRDQWRDHAHPALPIIDECAAIPGSCATTLRKDLTAGRTRIPLTLLDRWPCKFTHVLTLDRPARFVQALPFLIRVRQEGRFTLYRVAIPPGLACENALAKR